ncbi:eukaryotic rRNA processing protein EBP2-domain-containing protein [Peziza echinospora]|nr:eukaryotic rRNA processing protein EBP2-domain-containing protein [Peziza echinospora]
MVKSKLKIALDRFQQRDFEAEKDKKLRKKASKIQKAKKLEEEEESEEEEEEIPELIDASTKLPEKEAVEEAEEEEEDEEKDEEEEEEDEEEDDLAFSDVDSDEDLQDATPYTRLTINNKAALLNSLSKIALPFTTLPFSAHLSLTSTEPTEILDINDDLNRELAFYTQALAHARQARDILASEPNATPFSRPNDYFAEMVKSDEHMGKIKQKLLDEAADKKASADARKQRDLRKFGKKVQVEKLQERQKAKTETLGKIQALKRSTTSTIPGPALLELCAFPCTTLLIKIP